MEIIKHVGYGDGALLITEDVDFVFLRYEENGVPLSNHYAIYKNKDVLRVWNVHPCTPEIPVDRRYNSSPHRRLVYPIRFELPSFDAEIGFADYPDDQLVYDRKVEDRNRIKWRWCCPNPPINLLEAVRK